MSNEFVSADPRTFVERGFMSGRNLTLGGVRAVSRPTKSGESSRVGMQFFFTEIGKDGERRILTSFPHMGAWGDQMEPSDNLKGLVPARGADRPFIEKNSELGLFAASLAAAGCPPKLLNGNWAKLVGIEVVLEDKTLPSFGRKKSVDPDEAPAPAKEYKTSVVSKIITLPEANTGYKGLSEKEMTQHLKEQEDKRSARKAASGAEPDEPVGVVGNDDDDDTPAPVVKTKKAKPAPVEDDEDEPGDSFGEAEDEPAAEEEEPAEEEEADPAEALATKLILQVLKKTKKIKGSELFRSVHPLLAGTDKKTTAAVLKFAQTPKFIAGIEGVSIKNNMVVLG